MLQSVLLLNEGQVVGIGWVKVIFAGYKLEDNWVLLLFEGCGVAEVEGNKGGASLECIFLELKG